MDPTAVSENPIRETYDFDKSPNKMYFDLMWKSFNNHDFSRNQVDANILTNRTKEEVEDPEFISICFSKCMVKCAAYDAVLNYSYSINPNEMIVLHKICY